VPRLGVLGNPGFFGGRFAAMGSRASRPLLQTPAREADARRGDRDGRDPKGARYRRFWDRGRPRPLLTTITTRAPHGKRRPGRSRSQRREISAAFLGSRASSPALDHHHDAGRLTGRGDRDGRDPKGARYRRRFWDRGRPRPLLTTITTPAPHGSKEATRTVAIPKARDNGGVCGIAGVLARS
jgi:hypothetical protein